MAARSDSGATHDVAASNQYLTFTLGHELFALGILCVREIIEYGRLTPVPMMPASILGVINLRGAVVPVVDLRVRFGDSATLIGQRTCIVILEVSQPGTTRVIGVVVDAVNAVLDIPEQDIEPVPSLGARIRTDFIQGMGKVDERLVVLLDVGKVLSVEDMALLERAYQADTAQPAGSE
ncbi:MAG: chemotaxis protein CheW [Pseudomonas sp.]|uniref:chemotaxis protein CheW n=1 Tax=Pseudomonas sp. TaxID=306 RepID=UPI003D12558D